MFYWLNIMAKFPIPSVVHVASFFLYTSVFLPSIVPLEGLLQPLLSSHGWFLVLTSVQQPHHFLPCTPMFCWWADVTLLRHWGRYLRSQNRFSFSRFSFASWPCEPSFFSVHGLHWSSHTHSRNAALLPCLLQITILSCEPSCLLVQWNATVLDPGIWSTEPSLSLCMCLLYL